jgi:ferredoxin-nitrite reductase
LPPSTSPTGPFTTGQKEYLQGFMAGVAASGVFVGTNAAGQLTASPDVGGALRPDGSPANLAAPAPEQTFHGTPLGDLCKEERWKYDENPLDAWERLLWHADEDKFPDPENTYRFKFHGLFYVAPAQDSFMLRLRVPACELTAAQLHGLADLAQELGGGYAHITTRGNLQIREFKPRHIIAVLTRVQELGLASRGAGCDNVRNITASPDSGFAPDEVLDVRPYAKALHHYILNNRDLYGLPRKFNVAFDNGGSLSVAADTNDIGFTAVRVTDKSLENCRAGSPDPAIAPSSPLLCLATARTNTGLAAASNGTAARPEPGIYFRVQLGGITGHGDFARDTGLLIRPTEAVATAGAMIRVFAGNGDRTNRKKARLKYLLEKWGVEKFLEATQQKLAFPLVRLPLTACEPRRPVEKHAWLGARRQSQRGLNSLGVGVPVGRLTSRQMHGLADLAGHYGRGELRLTVWQNLLIPHLSDAFLETTKRAVIRLGLYHDAPPAAGGIIACTGNKGCKYSAADTKSHALELMKHLGGRVVVGAPVNIHFTGCPHSCAQHYCGDIGFVGAKHADGSEAYHVVLGGGMDHEQGVAREVFRAVRAAEVNPLVEKFLTTYEAKKASGETFVQWARRHSVKELQEMFST